jgi:DnaJ-class molecular chaperone
MLTQQTHYEVLGVAANIEQSHIKQAAQQANLDAKKSYEESISTIKQAFTLLTQSKNADPQSRKKALDILGLDNQADATIIKQAAQEVAKGQKLVYEARIADIQRSFAILNSPDKRQSYDAQLLADKEKQAKREAAAHKAKVAKAISDGRKQTPFLLKLLKFVFLLLIVTALVGFYFNNQEMIDGWLAQSGIPYFSEPAEPPLSPAKR